MTPTAVAADFRETFARARSRNAWWILRIRAIGVVLWWIDHALFGYFGSRPEYVNTLLPLGIYAFLAWLLWALVRWRPALLDRSWLAIVLFDMPAVVIVQYTILFDSPSPGVVAGLTAAILTLLVVVSQLWLARRQTLGVAVVGAALGSGFMLSIGLDASTAVGAVLILSITGLVCWLVVGQVHGLVRDVVAESARKERLGRYLSPAVRDQVIDAARDDTAGALREVTVLFLDIRGFTGLSETMPPERVVSMLNDLHGRFVRVLFRHGGTLDKFLGDGLMAWFGAPQELPRHAAAAVACAVELCGVLDGVNAERAERGEAPLEIGIGLHTGRAVIGDIGTETRREYTAVGDTVNTAARVESTTKELGVRVLASEATVRAAGAEADGRGTHEVTLRGRSAPTVLHVLR